MSNTLRITRLSMALTVAAGLAACNDLSPSPHQVATPIAAAPPSTIRVAAAAGADDAHAPGGDRRPAQIAADRGQGR